MPERVAPPGVPGRAPTTPVTIPQIHALKPRRASSCAAASHGVEGKIAIMPTPILNVASRSGSADLAELLDESVDGAEGSHVARSIRTSQEAGITRARLLARPPPVTWLNACTSTVVDQRQAVAGVDPGGLEQLLAQGAAELRDVAVQRPAGCRRAARGGPASSRWSAGRTTPGRAPRRRRARAPAPRIWSASTTPVAAPATSYSSGPSRPGCSAVSPPTSAQPATHAALGDAPHDGGDALGHDLAARDVVGHEQRLGAAHDDVVDDHADQVEADGVVHVQRLRDGDLGADAVGRGGQQRAGRYASSAAASKSPAKPPMPPSTSGRRVLRDHVLHQLDGLVAGLDVDAGGGVASTCRGRCSAGHRAGSRRSAAAEHRRPPARRRRRSASILEEVLAEPLAGGSSMG